MTPREQLAERLESIAPIAALGEARSLDVYAAAAELRKVCRTCQHWGGTVYPGNPVFADECFSPVDCGPDKVPQDGSGFCHLHKPTEGQ